MIISIMKNIDLSALVSIANDPLLNEVDSPAETTTPTLTDLLTGSLATKVPETEPATTLASADSPTTTSVRQDSSLLTTTNDAELNTAANVR
jgi:hypothetical protein